MKRKREVIENDSQIKSAISELSKISLTIHQHIQPSSYDSTSTSSTTSIDSHNIPTKPFLHACNFLLLQALDKIGPTMAVLRQDVHQNIERLEKLYQSDSSVYSNLVEILKKEAREGMSRKTNSCTRSLVWLTRSMDFTVALLDKLVKEPEGCLKKAVEESYEITLKPWHRWISIAAYKVALSLVPESKTFINLLMAEDEDYAKLKEEIESLNLLLSPILNEIHYVLRSFKSDKLKSNIK